MMPGCLLLVSLPGLLPSHMSELGVDIFLIFSRVEGDGCRRDFFIHNFIHFGLLRSSALSERQ